ncbi:hypothetical protein BN7_4400 [Wickerhamomyces ciferrii]|uniref:Uncharacterized protein n=1 Tax=Wickerhamomyces ciferrii (strain ATCC 14091 / BCRC 22168 / CBS 111 / JCM 3599 / NBRC 0793 / NRRL Y-1031 F-60-10) TaxID=1206466 RepID=K0KPE7_WICCF|nr:uncharacterized protein BN7_4400 [Wickerhamomyces ciferrii]CCH44831.1 hypothetical protein BN7_4400 [Wickerhamomyces ciferrii]
MKFSIKNSWCDFEFDSSTGAGTQSYNIPLENIREAEGARLLSSDENDIVSSQATTSGHHNTSAAVPFSTHKWSNIFGSITAVGSRFFFFSVVVLAICGLIGAPIKLIMNSRNVNSNYTRVQDLSKTALNITIESCLSSIIFKEHTKQEIVLELSEERNALDFSIEDLQIDFLLEMDKFTNVTCSSLIGKEFNKLTSLDSASSCSEHECVDGQVMTNGFFTPSFDGIIKLKEYSYFYFNDLEDKFIDDYKKKIAINSSDLLTQRILTVSILTNLVLLLFSLADSSDSLYRYSPKKALAGSQAVTFAIRSGISIASGYAVKSVTKFLAKVPDDQRLKLERTKHKLQTRIEIVSSAIDLIKLVASRGNTNLSSTLKLTKDLKDEIDQFDDKIQTITESYGNKKDVNSVNNVKLYMLDLLSRIEEAIPLINLSLTTSGANLSGTLSNQVSPGRLLQASNFVNKSNELFNNKEELQIGPMFQLTLYSIFYHKGRIINNRLNEISWKEDFTRANVSVIRLPSEINEYDYVLRIKENFNDDRYHDDEDEPKLIELDISTITRLFFSASGKLLKLEDRSSPVLVLKINKIFDDQDSENSQSSISDLNQIEWLSLGEYEQLYNDSSDESGSDDEDNTPIKPKQQASSKDQSQSSLSLLEYILRLCVLQTNDQSSILEVNDERLALYLNDENHSSENPISSNTNNEFENESSPVRIIERKPKTSYSTKSTPSNTPKSNSTNDITSRLKKLEVTQDPSTPQKPGSSSSISDNSQEDKNGSPLPGDTQSNIQLTPWEKDKISKLKNFGTPVGGGYGTPSSLLRKKVLRRNLND